MTRDYHKLGGFDLGGIKKALRGETQVAVTFDIDSDGILSVRAEEKGSKN